MNEPKVKAKTGGRKAGTPNKKTEDFFDKCEKLGHDPITFNILIAQNKYRELGYDSATVTVYTKSGDSYEQDRISIETRLAANNKLLEFMYPKRKAIEHKISDEDKKAAFTFAYNTGPMKQDEQS